MKYLVVFSFIVCSYFPVVSATAETDRMFTRAEEMAIYYTEGSNPIDFAGCALPPPHKDYQILRCRTELQYKTGLSDYMQCVYETVYGVEVVEVAIGKELKDCDNKWGWEVINVRKHPTKAYNYEL